MGCTGGSAYGKNKPDDRSLGGGKEVNETAGHEQPEQGWIGDAEMSQKPREGRRPRS